MAYKKHSPIYLQGILFVVAVFIGVQLTNLFSTVFNRAEMACSNNRIEIVIRMNIPASFIHPLKEQH